MAVVYIENPDISQNIKTYLNQDYTSGSTLNVISSASFVNGNYVLVGEPNIEKTEITNLTATPPSLTSLTATALNMSHANGTPVTYINWDKYSLEYQTTSGGAWTVYGSMPASLVYDSLKTEYRDEAATSTYSWRYRYYSTEKGVYSGYSSTISAPGWGRKTVGYMVREIRKIINDPEKKTVSDTEIIRFLNAGQDKIYSLYDRWWFLLKTGTALTSVSGQKIYNLPSDFGRMQAVQFRYVNGASDITYNLKGLPIIEFDYIARDNNATSDDEVKYYSIYPGDSSNPTGYLYIWPKPLTAGLSITPRYYKNFTDLAVFADTTEVSIPDILENYALSQILKIRKEDDKSNSYEGMFKEQIQLLKMMQKKRTDQLRSLWNYRGRDAEKRLFGTRDIYDAQTLENYW